MKPQIVCVALVCSLLGILGKASAAAPPVVATEPARTWGLKLMAGLSRRGTPVLSLVWEERNFTPLCSPELVSCLLDQTSLRGGGALVRLELIRISVVPDLALSCFRLGSPLVWKTEGVTDWLHYWLDFKNTSPIQVNGPLLFPLYDLGGF
jgi:hypothetical protein